MTMKETKVSSIGERALISRLSEIFNAPDGEERRQEEVLIGAGSDDCAVLDLKGEDYLVVTTDMLHMTTDFPEGMTPPGRWLDVCSRKPERYSCHGCRAHSW